MRLKGQSYPVLVLNAKGGEIQAKANGSANHLWISKNIKLEFVFRPKFSYCKIWFIMGENFDYGKKGEFLALDQIYSWSISQFAQTNGFDLEIGKRICFFENKPSGGKSDQNMPNSMWEKLVFKLHSLKNDIALWVAFKCVGINHQKGGDWKGNVPLGHFYKYFGD
jgi:hypothetical protein